MENHDQEEQLIRYRDWRPTGFDPRGLGLPDRQDWFVLPVMRTRDSNVRDESNFAAALDELGGESDAVEVHRFGHWGPGWFEIILVASSTPEATIAEEIDRALADYPVLDDVDYAERELAKASECWERFSLEERMEACRRFGLSIFAARRDDMPEDARGELVSYLAE
jgi:hypothetical protein